MLIEKDYLTHTIDYFTLCSFNMILGLTRSYTCILKHDYALIAVCRDEVLDLLASGFAGQGWLRRVF